MPSGINLGDGTLPICAKLRDWPAVEKGEDALDAGFVSKRMCEAAELITALVGACAEALALLVKCRAPDKAMTNAEAMLKLVLAKARAESSQ